MPFDRKERFIPIFEALEDDKTISIDLYMNTLEEAFINIGLDEDRFMRDTRKFSTSSCHGDDPIEIEN
jgi:ATP-binding cassette, subfamily A (ABC1), member 3